MPERLSNAELQWLAAFAHGANLRAAASALGVPKSTLSRKVSELEARLGQDLFLRHGRRVTTTRYGERLIERAESAARALDAAQAAADDTDLGLRLTIAASPLFAELVLGEALDRLVRLRPALLVELRLTHDYADLFGGEVDVALRRGPVPDSTSISARRLGKLTMVCVGAPALAPHGTPEERARALPWIRVGGKLEPLALRLSVGRRARSVTVAPRIAADSQRLAIELARRGIGAARVNAFMVRDELASGALIDVLPEARSTEETFAVFARKRTMRPELRDFLDALVTTSRAKSLWDG